MNQMADILYRGCLIVLLALSMLLIFGITYDLAYTAVMAVFG